ncbi:MAG TPA: DUF1361 domain-containing protein [Cyclobacteriaceae bacterium]|jgi:uncharacterized membrane protein|nr:DUF1361 domain-containing protein [Cyclobacteriaceae bacterium]
MIYIFKRLQAANRLHALVLFFLTTTLCVTLVAVRVHFTETATFVFLVWNIFLALIPYGVSTLLVLYQHKFTNRWFLFFPIVLWLLFFPNAPYILTDLFHLKHRAGIPYWYDLGLILFFAWNGLMLGFASLMDIQTILTKHFNKTVGWLVALSSLTLGSYGIYLGRYLRWNSWDIVSSPLGLLHDVIRPFFHPSAYPKTFGVTLIFSLFLVIAYLMLIQMAKAFKSTDESL